MRILAIFLPIASVACGGVTSSSSPGDAGGHSDAGDRTGADAGGRTADALTGSASDASGMTLVLQAFGGPSGAVAAQIPLLEPGVGPERSCGSPQVAGACQLISCANGGIADPGPGYGDFGPISASVGATTVPITYNGVAYGTVYFPGSVVLGTGGTMTFKGGSWEGIPAFDISATIPGLAEITSPVPTTDGGTAVLDTSHDLLVTWKSISSGTIELGLEGGSEDPGGTSVSIACSFEGSRGSGTIAQALLASMKEAAGSNPAYAEIDSQLAVTTVVDGLTIVMESYQSSPDVPSSFAVTLQ